MKGVSMSFKKPYLLILVGSLALAIFFQNCGSAVYLKSPQAKTGTANLASTNGSNNSSTPNSAEDGMTVSIPSPVIVQPAPVVIQQPEPAPTQTPVVVQPAPVIIQQPEPAPIQKTAHDQMAEIFRISNDISNGVIPLMNVCTSFAPDSGNRKTLLEVSQMYYVIYGQTEGIICDEHIDVLSSAISQKRFQISASCLSRIKDDQSYTIKVYNPADLKPVSFYQSTFDSFVAGPEFPSNTVTRKGGQVIMWGLPLGVFYKKIGPELSNTVYAYRYVAGCETDTGTYSQGFYRGIASY